MSTLMSQMYDTPRGKHSGQDVASEDTEASTGWATAHICLLQWGATGQADRQRRTLRAEALFPQPSQSECELSTDRGVTVHR